MREQRQASPRPGRRAGRGCGGGGAQGDWFDRQARGQVYNSSASWRRRQHSAATGAATVARVEEEDSDISSVGSVHHALRWHRGTLPTEVGQTDRVFIMVEAAGECGCRRGNGNAATGAATRQRDKGQQQRRRRRGARASASTVGCHHGRARRRQNITQLSLNLIMSSRPEILRNVASTVAEWNARGVV